VYFTTLLYRFRVGNISWTCSENTAPLPLVDDYVVFSGWSNRNCLSNSVCCHCPGRSKFQHSGKIWSEPWQWAWGGWRTLELGTPFDVDSSLQWLKGIINDDVRFPRVSLGFHQLLSRSLGSLNWQGRQHQQRQRGSQKTMIWLVEWGKIIVLHEL